MARTVTIVESDFTLPIEDEWYAATLIGIEDGRSKFGATFKWIFELSVAPDEEEADKLNGLKVNALTSAGPSLKNFCGRIVRTLSNMEDALGQSVDVDELIGIACEIKTTHKESGQGGKFANVTSVRLPTGRTVAAAAPGWGTDDEEPKTAPPKSDKKQEPKTEAPPKPEPAPPVEEPAAAPAKTESKPTNPVSDSIDEIPF